MANMEKKIIDFVTKNPGLSAAQIHAGGIDILIKFDELVSMLIKLSYRKKSIRRVFETKDGSFGAFYYPLPSTCK